MRPQILIASPVRNRAWILPQFLAALEGLDFPAEDVAHHFLVNDCADDSPAILRAWAAGRPRATVEQVDTGVAGWNRYHWPHYDYANLAFLRNRILERFLEGGATHLFSVDSDVIVPPHALAALLAADRPAVAGVIANLPGFSVEESPAHNFLYRSGDFYRHERTVPDGLFEVDVMGAVALIRRDVAEAGVRYEGRRSGEDVAFCERAREKGFRLWCHGGVRCLHRMDDPAQPRPSLHPIERALTGERDGGTPDGARRQRLQPPPWRQPHRDGAGGSGTVPPVGSGRVWPDQPRRIRPQSLPGGGPDGPGGGGGPHGPGGGGPHGPEGGGGPRRPGGGGPDRPGGGGPRRPAGGHPNDPGDGPPEA